MNRVPVTGDVIKIGRLELLVVDAGRHESGDWRAGGSYMWFDAVKFDSSQAIGPTAVKSNKIIKFQVQPLGMTVPNEVKLSEITLVGTAKFNKVEIITYNVTKYKDV